ncbi:AEC family transporter [Anoxynatronum buryatiense]|uniref:Auxin efflux carrier n=1 Tax=Anoxynatronum buryatiense TaxID=489973 RepID=A0AA46AIS4_9CLOT|nr:AEC family transporter [Anoxynatronum buryatiense]SMP52441.1 hypothetical protein SAMN06296020_104234 [Anoxynatronum buryatiense]
MNDAFFSLLNQILVLFFMMAAGYAARKAQVLNQETIKGISLLILQVTLPSLIVSSMQFPFSMELLHTSLLIVGISIVTYGVIILFSRLYVRLVKEEGPRGDVLQFLLVFSNVAFMGFPIVSVLYGDLGIFYTALFNIPFNLLLVTLGVAIMSRSTGQSSGKMNFKKAFRSPGVIAVLLGFTFFVLPVSIPGPLLESLQLIGGTTTPLSMMIIGGMLADIPFRSVFGDRALYQATVVRLLLMPLMMYLPLRLLGFTGIMLGIPVIIIAMPVAANAGAFARLYDSDYYFASKAVFLTTLCSILTIPLWALFL